MFSYYPSSNRNETPRERELREQLEQIRSDQQAEQDRAYQQRERARKDRQREREEAMLYANDWWDGFNKGLPRFRSEAAAEAKMNDECATDPELAHLVVDSFFAEQVKVIERGLVIFNEEMDSAQTKIYRLEALIEKVKDQARQKTADRIDSEFGRETGLGEALRENNPDYLTNW